MIITGGAGFLGSHVADVFAEQGHDVTIVDVRDNPAHDTKFADLRDYESLTRAFAAAEIICHLAAVGDVYLAGDQPALAATINVTGTANVCAAALACGARKVVYASTWEVYGTPRYQPLDEEHPCDPDHPYNITKLAGERIAMSYAHLRGLDVSALRLGTAYGLRMRPNSVFSLFIDRALRGEPLTIQGTGGQGRQFTHARDIGRAFALAMEAQTGRVYNVVADELTTIRTLAEMVSERIPTTLAFAEARKGDVPSALVSSDRIAQELGWRAEVPFRQGLEELIADARG